MGNLEVGRLAVVAIGVVVVLLVFILLVRSCGGSSTASKNQDYVDVVKQQVLSKSEQASRLVQSLFQAPRPVKAKAAAAQIGRALDIEKQALSVAEKIKPTKQAEPYHPSLIEAISFRITGLQYLQKGMVQAYRAKPAVAGGKLLVPGTQRLLTSDYVYSDRYAGRLNNALADAGVDARVPTSVFLPPKLQGTLTPAGMGLVLQRLKPGAVSGLHGMSLDTVIVQTGGKSITLRPGGDVNPVPASTDMVFVVSVTNGGNFQEFNVPVTIKLGTGKSAPVKTAKIDQIGPGDTATVEVSGLTTDSSSLAFGRDTKVTVSVGPVPGERNASNNKAVYTVAFQVPT
jgi:hypothetical protein